MTDTRIEDPLGQLAKGIWWWVLLRGLLAIAFGIIALLAPAAAITAVAIIFGAYALVDGIITAVQAVRMRKSFEAWGWLLVQGILTALAGLAVLILPGVAAVFGGLFVLWVIVIWNIAQGIAGIRSAAGTVGRAKTWGVLAGVISIIFGIVLAILMFVTPGATLLGLIWAVGIYAVVFGIVLVITAFQARSDAHQIKKAL